MLSQKTKDFLQTNVAYKNASKSLMQLILMPTFSLVRTPAGSQQDTFCNNSFNELKEWLCNSKSGRHFYFQIGSQRHTDPPAIILSKGCNSDVFMSLHNVTILKRTHVEKIVNITRIFIDLDLQKTLKPLPIESYTENHKKKVLTITRPAVPWSAVMHWVLAQNPDHTLKLLGTSKHKQLSLFAMRLLTYLSAMYGVDGLSRKMVGEQASDLSYLISQTLYENKLILIK